MKPLFRSGFLLTNRHLTQKTQERIRRRFFWCIWWKRECQKRCIRFAATADLFGSRKT